VQDTAYQSLLKSKRQQLHQQIAQTLEQRFTETVETQPELLAHHYSEAGLLTQAIPYWQQAGQRASQHSANVEAISHLTKGLELLKALPDTPERAQQELMLQITRNGPLTVIKGYMSPEVEKALTRARELCRHIGETPQLYPVLYGLSIFHLGRAELQTARELAEQLMHLAQRQQDATLIVQAHYMLGLSLFYLGKLAQAREQVEQGIILYDPQQHRVHTFLYGRDPGTSCRGLAALALWSLGYPDQALKRIYEAITLAQGLSHPFSLAWALEVAARLHQFRQEGQAAQERAETTITLSTEQGFSLLGVWGTITKGWALTEQGWEEEGIAHMRQGLAAYRAMGGELYRPYDLALLAGACRKVGQIEEGITLLTEALAAVDKNEERFYEAELYRLKGELTLQKTGARGWELGTESSSQASSLKSQVPSRAEEAEGYFLKAIEIARCQGAKSLELRAVMSLSRLWQQQGKKEEARQILTEIYSWFTEGFDTKDLQEAKVLLEELT
jgi:predicted ATPase